MPIRTEDSGLNAALTGSYFGKFGVNYDAPIGLGIIWPLDGTTYPWPAAAADTVLDSSDAADNGKTFLVQGLDPDGLEVSETIVMANATAGGVLLQTKFYRVYRVVCAAPITNAGDISASHGLDILAWIPIGLGITQQLIYTVPVNKVWVVSTYLLSLSANKGADFQIWVRPLGGSFVLQGDFFLIGGAAALTVKPSAPVLPLYDVYMAADSDAAGKVSASVIGQLFNKGRYQEEPGPREVYPV